MSCHGKEKGGVQIYPALVGLKGSVVEGETLEKIRQGGGLMPGIKGVLTDDEERELMAFYTIEKMSG